MGQIALGHFNDSIGRSWHNLFIFTQVPRMSNGPRKALSLNQADHLRNDLCLLPTRG